MLPRSGQHKINKVLEEVRKLELHKLKLQQEIEEIESKIKGGVPGSSSTKRPAIDPLRKKAAEDMVYDTLADRRRRERASASAAARKEDEFSDGFFS